MLIPVCQLVTLPRKPTVVQLLKEYEAYALHSKSSPRSKNLIVEVLAGLTVYFDKALGHTLLYRFERQQYADLRKKKEYEETPMSEVYGAEHLLRLFGEPTAVLPRPDSSSSRRPGKSTCRR